MKFSTEERHDDDDFGGGGGGFGSWSPSPSPASTYILTMTIVAREEATKMMTTWLPTPIPALSIGPGISHKKINCQHCAYELIEYIC